MTAVMRYIELYGSFNSYGWYMEDPKLEEICQKALDENRKIKDSELYEESGADILY